MSGLGWVQSLWSSSLLLLFLVQVSPVELCFVIWVGHQILGKKKGWWKGRGRRRCPFSFFSFLFFFFSFLFWSSSFGKRGSRAFAPCLDIYHWCVVLLFFCSPSVAVLGRRGVGQLVGLLLRRRAMDIDGEGRAVVLCRIGGAGCEAGNTFCNHLYCPRSCVLNFA